MFSPLSQFQIFELFNLSNYFFYEICYLVFPVFFLFTIFWNLLVNGPFFNTCQSVFLQVYYSFVSMEVVQLGSYFFFYFLLLLSILLTNNLFGLFPYSFTLSSHIIFTFGLSFYTFLSLNMVVSFRFLTDFLGIFLPNGTPFFIIPLLVVIELVSYLSSLFSLAIRLFANIMSGHTLVHILLSFVSNMFFNGRFTFFFVLIPFGLCQLIFFMEFGIAILQTYVFITLVVNYLNDTISGEGH